MAERIEEHNDLFRGGIALNSFYPQQNMGSAVDGEEILERKKAWAELERE